MKLIQMFAVLWLLSSSVFAETGNNQPVIPDGYPLNGQLAIITSIDTDQYQIMVNGLLTKVYRAVKVVTPDMKRIFLFQIPVNSGVVLIRDAQGLVTEIWILPNNFEVPQV